MGWKDKKAVRLSCEFDNEVDHCLTKASAKLLGGLAKVKASCQVHLAGAKFGKWGQPQIQNPIIGIFTKHFFVDHNVEAQNTLMGVEARLGTYDSHHAHVVYKHFVKRKLLSSLKDKKSSNNTRPLAIEEVPGVKWSASLSTPHTRLFYINNVAEGEEGEGEREAQWGGVWGGRVGKHLHGKVEYVNTAERVEMTMKYKDVDVTLKPTLSLPSPELSLTLKRRLDDFNKISGTYHFHDMAWEGEYKFKPSRHLKLKAGHHSLSKETWMSMWLGKEDYGASKGPRKLKGQILFTLNHEENKYFLLCRFKKRVDFF